MINVLGGALGATPPVVAALFPDVGGYLLGPEFISLISNLVIAFLTNLISVLIGSLMGGA